VVLTVSVTLAMAHTHPDGREKADCRNEQFLDRVAVDDFFDTGETLYELVKISPEIPFCELTYYSTCDRSHSYPNAPPV